MRTRPDELTEVTLPDGRVTVDEHGYLTDPNLWSKGFAEYAAKAEGITLTPRHYEVINFVRASQEEHRIIPDQRFVLKFLGHGETLSKSEAKDALYELFPQGYVKQVCKIAGMKQPRACRLDKAAYGAHAPHHMPRRQGLPARHRRVLLAP